jgi:dienelactone hydrolase
MEAILFLPNDAKPPYQTVVWYPGDDAAVFTSSERLASPWLFDFIPRSGRALVYPIYDGWYERRSAPAQEPNARRDLAVRRAKDLRRTIDYLETRRDIDLGRIAFYGFSAGGINGPILAALEPRIRAAVLLSGGIPAMRLRPEIHPALFAPRAKAPTLMINGELDFLLPYETSQRPLFDLLGSPVKRHARLEGGHIPSNPHEMVREVLDWLDAHLGAVRT